MADWSIQGEYMETCNCDFLCPCITSNLTAVPTEGDCKAAIAMKITKGEKDGVSLDGLSFIVLLHAPGVMMDGDIKVGLIVDEAASDAQTAAISDIATGAAGGPMEALGPLVAEVAGVEKRPITFVSNGGTISVTAGDLIDQEIEAVASALPGGEPIKIDNVPHPVTTTLALARATKSKFNAFGIAWDDATGSKNGHFAPFAWSA
ncbi:DUF1326 domain-containing protein [Pseudodonghicola flavimaris]|uniref:DUF1326 domain-containing protein n=1 Tax=Pseudodonghicola flavimaris TaxID=3050036 RepID=A0ABT7F8A5_9RHOB|nr:DUF1326 domain-containing protein [Pseudodonghicola flavimaris]MDK3020845.1 DUF1326 domain-containing protein [Pseudodonghicola flavimaris]